MQKSTGSSPGSRCTPSAGRRSPTTSRHGRLSRALTTLLLLRAGYGYVPYSSLERVIEDNKDEYYRCLRAAQTDDAQLGEWLGFFLRCLVQQKSALAWKVERERLLTSLTPLDEALVALAKSRGRFTVAEAVAATGANRNTLKVRLRYLVHTAALQLFGRGRGAFYLPG